MSATEHDKPASAPAMRATGRLIALLGNPNVGKTTLLNRMSGLRAKTANFPGTTQDAHIGRAGEDSIIDLPGVYALDVDSSEAEICRAALAGDLAPIGEHARPPDAIIIVADATNLLRNLVLVAQALRLGLPVVVALNFIDDAGRRGLHIDRDLLSCRLGCPVVPICARSGDGVELLKSSIASLTPAQRQPDVSRDEIEEWADALYAEVASARGEPAGSRLSDRLDAAFTHPVLGVAVFAIVMTGLFWVIFRLAAYPMDWIDAIFASAGGLVASTLPPGALSDLIVNGAIAGVGATVIFLPQICLLFLLLALLEGSGYLARAAFVIDRVLRPFGLQGHSFVPLLSSHACALPGIMAARAVPDRRDRLATILSAPFMSCTARIPVYVLLTSLLFPNRPALQAVAFSGCYVVGILAGLLSAMLARRTILRGKSRPMALELPPYRTPGLRDALLLTRDRALVFLKKAGIAILGISIVLWWLGEYPHTSAPAEAVALRAQADAAIEDAQRDELLDQAILLESSHAARHTVLGRMGGFLEPVFAPMGADRQLTIGILASFAAREVFVSTMAVQIVGTEELDGEGLFERLVGARRDDGSLLFTPATSWALLVYYVLAMQCLPTLVVTAREAGHWKWAALQLLWMSGLAYALAVVVRQAALAAGGA